MNPISKFLNRITMYRLMLYFLIILFAVAILAGSLKIVSFFDPMAIVAQTIFLVAICWALNLLGARLVKTKPNFESPLITALILSFIVGPVSLPSDWHILAIIALAAIASKYLITINKSHIFNPATFGVTVSALALNYSASWWIGVGPMIWPIVLGGILILAKIRRFHLVITFFAIYAFVSVLNLVLAGNSALESLASLRGIIASPPLLFFVFVMLIEPLTAPQTLRKRVCFGAFAGLALFLLQRFTPWPYSLELALLAGNIFTKIVNPDFRQSFALKRREDVSPAISNFWFEPTKTFSFIPGQFLEYTLSHPRSDSEGTRRFFTIASSPTEKEILLTTRFSEKNSSFKQKLKSLRSGEEIIASKVSGEFTLPADKNKKLAFIAGGIGVTPFRSIVKYLLDTDQSRDIILLYAVKMESDLVFRDIFGKAQEKFGMKSVHILSDETNIPHNWQGRKGFLDAEIIQEEVPDFKERLFYVSGPEPMVKSIEKVLGSMGISRRQIKRDYFPGYKPEPK